MLPCLHCLGNIPLQNIIQKTFIQTSNQASSQKLQISNSKTTTILQQVEYKTIHPYYLRTLTSKLIQ